MLGLNQTGTDPASMVDSGPESGNMSPSVALAGSTEIPGPIVVERETEMM